MATEKVINAFAAVLFLLLCLCATNDESVVSALAIQNPVEPQRLSKESENTAYNASEPIVSVAPTNDTSQKETSKVIIGFDLPSAQPSPAQSGEGTTGTGETPVLKLIINQSDGIIVNATQVEAPATAQPSGASDDSQKTSALSDQQQLIPPSAVNGSIAQLPVPGETHKQQGKIVIR